MDLFFQLFIMIFFMIMKGFFSGSEIAMVNCDKLKMRHQAKTGNTGAKKVLKLYETPDVILGTTLVGTNVATVTVATMGALIFIDLFGSIGDLISTIVLTPFLLILGEIVPKSVYQQKADQMAPVIIYPLRFFSLLFFPIIFIFSRVARFATKLVGGDTQNENVMTRENIRMLLEMSETPSDVNRFDKKRIARIIRFGDTTVGETMIPLAEVVGIRNGTSMKDAMEVIWTTGYNRLPVYEGNITNIVGVLTLNTWDLMDPEVRNMSLEEKIEEPIYLSAKTVVDQVVPDLHARKDHFGVVVDEFGSAVGIIAMEDIFEEVVGEINVGFEFDEYKPQDRKTEIVAIEGSDDTFEVDGRTPISRLNEQIFLNIPVGEAHTVAGFMESQLRKIPVKGEYVTYEDFRFTVISATPRLVERVRIHRM